MAHIPQEALPTVVSQKLMQMGVLPDPNAKPEKAILDEDGKPMKPKPAPKLRFEFEEDPKSRIIIAERYENDVQVFRGVFFTTDAGDTWRLRRD